MELEGTPNVLSEALAEMQPAEESLERIYRGLGDATLEAEQARLRERFLDIGGRLITINQVRESE